MNFNVFIEKIEHQLLTPLPGEEAHFKVAPFERTVRDIAYKSNPNPTLSAVLALFYPIENVSHCALILRNTYKGVHSAQIGFPGGKKELTDRDLIETACREAEEEIGVNKKQITVLGKLSSVYIPPSGFLVQPYVGFSPERPDFSLDSREVNKLIELPTSLLIDESVISQKSVYIHELSTEKTYPCFDFNGDIVWGATAMMLSELKEIIKRFYLQKNRH